MTSAGIDHPTGALTGSQCRSQQAIGLHPCPQRPAAVEATVPVGAAGCATEPTGHLPRGWLRPHLRRHPLHMRILAPVQDERRHGRCPRVRALHINGRWGSLISWSGGKANIASAPDGWRHPCHGSPDGVLDDTPCVWWTMAERLRIGHKSMGPTPVVRRHSADTANLSSAAACCCIQRFAGRRQPGGGTCRSETPS